MLKIIIEMLKDNKEVLLFLLFLAILFCLLYVLLYKLSEKFDAKVLRTSKRINGLIELNNKYSFHNIKPTIFYGNRLKSKAQFDRFNFDKHLDDIIEGQTDYYDEMFTKLTENATLYERYLEELKKLPNPTTREEAKNYTIFVSNYLEVEEDFYYEKLIVPVVAVNIDYRITYTSPQGRNSYSDNKIYCYNSVQEHVDKVKKKIALKDSKEYQRKIMTDSLRYDILKRDKFQCTLCGCKVEDGVKLHVDHIIPVSKGGKTIASNLRTLCNRCNMGKSDKYDENDVN